MSGLISGGLALFSGATAAKAAKSQGEADQAAAQYNRAQAIKQAEATSMKASIDAGSAERKGERVIGAAKAIAGGSGFTLAGSAADVLGDLAAQRSFDVRTLLYAGETERRALLEEAANYERVGVAAVKQAKYRATAAILDGAYGAAKGVESFAASKGWT